MVPRNWQQAINGDYRYGFWGLAVLGGGVIVISFAFLRDLTEGGGIVSDFVYVVVHCEGRWEERKEGVKDRQTRGVRLS